MKLLRWVRYKLRQRREKVYWFEGVQWSHRPVDIQTAGLVGQVVYELVGKDDSKTPPESPPTGVEGEGKEDIMLGKLLSEVLDAEAMAKIVGILLHKVPPPESPPAKQGGMGEDWRRFMGFPAEDAWEVITDFFIWNKNSAMSIALSAGAMIGTKKGSNGRVRTLDRDSAN